jgi:hypothetical protein
VHKNYKLHRKLLETLGLQTLFNLWHKGINGIYTQAQKNSEGGKEKALCLYSSNKSNSLPARGISGNSSLLVICC